MRHFFILCFLSILAIFLGNSTLQFLHKVLPQEFSRTAFLIETVKNGMEAEVVIFGNSIAMSGVDAGQLDSLCTSLDIAFNLASNGQYLNESILYYPSVNPPTKLVIQMLRSTELSEPFRQIENSVQRNFYFGGYDFDVNVEKLFDVDLGLDYSTEANHYLIKNDHRGLLVNSLNTILKNGLRKDVHEKEKETDLSFPNIYTQKLSEDKLQILINKYNPPQELANFQLHPEKRNFILKTQAYFEAKGITYIVVILPFNEKLSSYSRNYKSSVNRSVAESQLPIISLIDAIPSEEFIDHCHLSKKGAKRLTLKLFQKLKSAGYAF